VALHIAKNFLMDAGAFDNMCRTPLILGIWGGKGQGKSFQTELCFKKLG
jgi:pantothenate kinase-related protein Tda10